MASSVTFFWVSHHISIFAENLEESPEFDPEYGTMSPKIPVFLQGLSLTYSKACCIAFNAHVNHITAAAAAPSKSCHGQKMSGVGNAQFWNRDATEVRGCVLAPVQNVSHMWRSPGC